jgi:hypothetical protein
MQIPKNVSSSQLRWTSHFTDNRKPSELFARKPSIYRAREFVTDPTPNTTRSFLAQAKNFFTGLFRRNPDLRFQRTIAPIFIKAIPKMTGTECNQLQLFGGERVNILSAYAKAYAEKLSGPEWQEFMKAKPALMANSEKDFVEKFHEIRATALCQALPIPQVLYQAHEAIPLRSNNDCASVKDFARFIERQDTAKAFASWLEICTRIPKPEEAAKPPLLSICDKLSHGDAHAVTHFLSISDEALRQTMEDYPKSFLEALNMDPNSSLDLEARAALHEKYLKNFCAALDNLLALDKKKSSPQSLTIRLEQAHHTAMCTVIKPPSNPFDNNLVFSHLQKLIGEGTEKKLKEKAQLELKQVSAQAIAEDPKEPNRATYRGFEMECDLHYKNTKSFIACAWEGTVKRLPVIRDWRRLRPSTKKPKPRDIGDLGNVSIAADRTRWEAKVKHAPDIINRFVQDFDWNYPALWSKLKQCEIDHLAKIIAMPADIAILDLIPQSVSQSPANDGRDAQPSEFSPGFLTALRSLESEIDASIYGIQFTRDMTKPELKLASNPEVMEPEQALDPEVTGQETKDHFNPKVTKEELRSAQIRRWGKPPLTEAELSALRVRPSQAKERSTQAAAWSDRSRIQNPTAKQSENPAPKPGPYNVD